ncbi:hypothetical protein [Sphingomonas morindae]|uniref:Uncharacterized protein n=1 Tax=Sphingomonas morindae TaxID=1541170 RepID=A0ABY4X461_9SPHN|nr:hypothetical protein [Sphingomonas morindae]USI71645.1 hypothetical protein LHA26_09885 [Sphingomonas morindae]
MSDRPIIFSAPMVRALIEGRKTQTRRLLSLRGRRGFSEFGPSDTPGYDWHFRDAGMRWHDVQADRLLELLPYAAGDRLYVREAWSHTGHGVWSIEQARMAAHVNGRPIYRATDETDAGTKFWPSIHMPREFSRLTLMVEALKVERLQDISEEDALKEGVEPMKYPEIGEWGWPQRKFADLWRSLHGPDSWEANPWVVAPTFSVIRANIDSLPNRVAA